jgi:hypothetical protein
MFRRLLTSVLLAFLIIVFLTGCDNSFQDNALGYNFVGANYSNKTLTTQLAPSHAKPVAHLRPYGIGLPPEAFVTQYGQPLVPSQPPTQFWFKASLDTFPSGSIMVVGFDRSSNDSAPRANEISFVAGDKHPTTDTQAETIAESFLPDDAQGPAVIHKYDAHANTCQSDTYTSATLATLFPAQDFIDTDGKVAKPGTITLSLFPHYTRYTANSSTPSPHEDISTMGTAPDQPNGVSSFLLTLGTKPYC